MTTHTAAHRTEDAASLRVVQAGLHTLFGVLLVIAAVRSASTSGRPALALSVSAALGAWYVAGVWLASRARGAYSGVVWLAALLAGWLALVAFSVEFSWVAFALFFLCMNLLPLRSAVVVITGLTGAVVAAQLAWGSGNPTAQVLGPCLGALVVVGVALTYRRILAESEQRRLLVTQLVAARDDLVATHDELAATQREAGALAERARLARDIHDTLAQGFSSIVLLARAGLAGSSEVATLLTQIESTAADNLEEARRVVHALAPAALDATPLPAAVGRLLERLTEQTGIKAALHVDGQVRAIPTGHEVALLRLVQGALANVRQHSGASRVTVTLTYRPDVVTLDVVDDGSGFDVTRLETASLSRTGFGLRAMRERLAGLGGTLIIESGEGEGTAVAATTPLPDVGP